MDERKIQFRLGVGAILTSLFFLVYMIPNWVSAPSNIRNFVLSPVMWPYVIAGLTGVTGLALLASSRQSAGMTPRETCEDDIPPPGGYLRLLLLAALIIAMMWLTPAIGLVWVSMAAYLLTALLVRTRHLGVVIICAGLIPLVLYIFFAHVAGVAIPQGDFVRLP